MNHLLRTIILVITLQVGFATGGWCQVVRDSAYYQDASNRSWGLRASDEGCDQLLELTREFSTDSALRYPDFVRVVYSNAFDCIIGSKGPSEALPLFAQYRTLAYARCPKLIPWYHFNMGKMLFESAQNDSVLEHLNLAFDRFKSDGTDMSGLSLSSEHLAGLYMRLGDVQRSLHFRELALEYAKSDKWMTSVQLLNLSVHHMKVRDFAKAREYILRQIEVDTDLGRSGGMPYINLLRVDANLNAPNDELALDYQRGLSGCMHDPDCQRYAHDTYSNILMDRKRYQEARVVLAKLDSLNRNCAMCDGYIASYHHQSAELEDVMGNPRKALYHFKEYLTMYDKINAYVNRNNLQVAEANYEFRKKKEEMELEKKREMALAEERLRAERLQKVVFIGFSLMMLLLAVLIYRNLRNQRRHSAQIESQKLIIEKEHERSEELLLNILPQQVAEELKAYGAARAQQFDRVTILFTDFKGFTSMAEKLEPSQLVEDLNLCFSAFDHIMERHGLEKIKTIGDAYMAAGGLPIPNTTHPMDAVRAALEMLAVIEGLKAAKQAAGLPFFEIRIGLHTGPVVAGIVGIKKFQYDIWGDTVNTASRMESSGEVGQVNISEATYALVKHHFKCTFRGEVEAKGKGRLGMYFVESTQFGSANFN